MPTSKPTRLLIADDDPALVEAYVPFFAIHGYAIQTACDGVSALDGYRVWRPDVVMLDIQMPHMDGWAVAQEIRGMSVIPPPLLLAVTALSSASDRAKSFNAGFDLHFVKPAQLSAILAAIAAHTLV